jgi:N-sulfoglucosamine sulfohydrolase
MTRLVEDEVQMMMRIGWWRVVGLFAFALVIHAGRATSVAQGGEHSKRPNILFILTEDQGAQMSLLGTAGLRTPNMDRIARQGVYFRKAFVTYPVCSASKAAIYTGLYNQTNGLRQNTMNLFKAADEITPKERQHPLFRGNRILDRYPTLIECLHEAGSYTGITVVLVVQHEPAAPALSQQRRNRDRCRP